MGLDLLFSHEIFRYSEVNTPTCSSIPLKALHSSLSNGNFHPYTNDTPTILESKFPPIGTKGASENQEKLTPNNFHFMTKSDQVKDALEIIEAMRQSCETAICTLNDVLLYDKIEEGKMVLEKRKMSVIKLLSDTIKPFFIQVM